MDHAALASRAVAGIAPGDHVFLSFGSNDELGPIVGRYAHAALDRGAQFVYLADRSDEATVGAQLDAAGIDVERGLSCGQIVIRRWLVADGEVDVDAMVRAFETLKHEALADGYSALVAASEMSWSLQRPVMPACALAYERAVDKAFGAGDVIGLCLYDRRLFRAELMQRLSGAHSQRLVMHEHGTTAVRRRLTISERDDRTLALAGELDIDGAAYLDARLAELRAERDLVIDTTRLTFVDVAGCRTLVEAAARMGEDRRMVLPDVSPALVRVLRICGWDAHPSIVLTHR